MGKIVCTFGKILAMPLLVNIAIQMVCLWPVGILNLVGHNEKYWLTSNCVTPYKVTFFTFYFIFFTITHSTLTALCRSMSIVLLARSSV